MELVIAIAILLLMLLGSEVAQFSISFDKLPW
jgi:hypothetical protein